jgi:hypothetical protein
MGAFDDLHDAVLEDIRLTDWRAGRLELRVGLAGESRLYVFLDIGSLKLTRTFAWGPSVFINSAACHDEGGSYRLRIEVQSGDVIEVKYRSCEVTGSPSS